MATTRTLETSVRFAVQATARATFDTGRYSESAVGTSFALETLASGVGADEANRTFHIQTTLEANEVWVLDVHDFAGADMGTGNGRDPVGQPLAIEEIVLLVVYKTNLSSGSLTVEPDATAGWSPIGTNTMQPGRELLVKYHPGSAGLDVDPTTSNRVKFTAGSEGSVQLQVLVVGRHDDEESESSSVSSSSSNSSSSTSTPSSTSSITSVSSSTLSTTSSTSTTSLSSRTVSSSSQTLSTSSTSTLSTLSSSSTSTLSSSSTSTLSSSTVSSLSTLSTLSSMSSPSPGELSL